MALTKLIKQIEYRLRCHTRDSNNLKTDYKYLNRYVDLINGEWWLTNTWFVSRKTPISKKKREITIQQI